MQQSADAGACLSVQLQGVAQLAAKGQLACHIVCYLGVVGMPDF